MAESSFDRLKKAIIAYEQNGENGIVPIAKSDNDVILRNFLLGLAKKSAGQTVRSKAEESLFKSGLIKWQNIDNLPLNIPSIITKTENFALSVVKRQPWPVLDELKLRKELKKHGISHDKSNEIIKNSYKIIDPPKHWSVDVIGDQ